MKKLIIILLLSLPFTKTPAQGVFFETQFGAIIPTGETADIYNSGGEITVNLGANLLVFDAMFTTGVGVLFEKNNDNTKEFDITSPAILVPAMGKVRYSLLPGPIKPYVSAAAGIMNSFNIINDNNSAFVVRPSVGIKMAKFIVDLAYTATKGNLDGEIPLRTFNISASLSL